jgi:hypothetical protein
MLVGPGMKIGFWVDMGVSSAMATGSGRAQGFAIFSEKVIEGGRSPSNHLYYMENYLV